MHRFCMDFFGFNQPYDPVCFRNQKLCNTTQGLAVSLISPQFCPKNPTKILLCSPLILKENKWEHFCKITFLLDKKKCSIRFSIFSWLRYDECLLRMTYGCKPAHLLRHFFAKCINGLTINKQVVPRYFESEIKMY